jgi:hypothetical protein
MKSDRVLLIAATLPLFVYGTAGEYEVPDPVHFGALVVAAVAVAAVAGGQRWAGTFVLGAVLALGAYTRATLTGHRASDVMLTTNEAVGVLFGGGNPYTHIYMMTNPPGGPFGYPPGEILFYAFAHLLGGNVFRVDVACSIFSLGLIAVLTPLAGDGLAAVALGVIAYDRDIMFHLVDGSNDNAAALLVLAGLVALAWSLASSGRNAAVLWWISAAAFGWSLAFKEYALPIALFVGLFLWRRDARAARPWIAAVLSTAALFVLPFLAWNPVALIANVGGALVLHSNVWGRNAWHDAVSFLPFAGVFTPFIPLIMLAAIIGLAVVFWRRPAPSLGIAFLHGLALVVASFMLARWTTSVYYMFCIPLLMGGAVLAFGEQRSTASD